MTSKKRNTDTVPFQDKQPIFKKLFEVCELANLSPEECRRYQWSLDLYRSNRAAWEYAGKEAREQGLQQGLQQGRAEGRAEGEAVGLKKGRAEGLLQAAQAMLASGMSKEQVAAMLGIDAKQL